ncbi:MAG: TRAP transporter large permease [Pseudomonadota bacterium]
MSNLELGFWSFPILLIMVFLRAPIGLAMLLCGFAGWYFAMGGNPNVLLNKLKSETYTQFSSYSLSIIPMFLLMGQFATLSGMSSALFKAAESFLGHRRGGVAMASVGACAGFGAICGSSLATAATMSKVALPELRRYGYSGGFSTATLAAGGTLGILIPPSVTMIVYGIATETSIGRLFLAGVFPGLLLVGLFMAWSLYSTWRSGNAAVLSATRYSWRQKLEILPRVLPFLAIIIGVLYAMYGGVATPSETAAVGALLCLLVAVVIYRLWAPADLWVVLRDSTKESVMILFIIAAAGVFSYMLSSLFITQSIAEWIGTLEVNRWVLMGAINLFLLIAGFFLPPVAVILMAAPILLPIITSAGFDPIWFAVVLTINMEIGLISPPVGLNLYVINGIAPDISLRTILTGSLPFVACMVVAIVLLCLVPGIATWLPDQVMGPMR